MEAGDQKHSTTSMSAHLNAVSRVSSLVWRILGDNASPGHLQGTNIYIVGTGAQRILIDTGEVGKPEFVSNLKRTLSDNGTSIQEILVTHWHPDHVGGISDICEELNLGSDIRVSKLPRHPFQAEEICGSELKYNYLQDGEKIVTEGATLRAVYTPGHSDDHMILVLEEENAIFTGDCVLGEGTAVFEDLYTYMRSLAMLVSLRPLRLYPGHGPVVDDAVPKLQMYIDHRNMRERQIIAALEAHKHEDMTPMDLVHIIYIGTPEALYPAAALNVSHHLKKLEKEGKISKSTSEGSYHWKSNL